MRSTSTQVNLAELVNACVFLGDESGKLVRSIFEGGRLTGVDKSTSDEANLDSHTLLEAEDPQTVADLKAQQIIIGSLQNLFPNVPIRGEEGELQIDESLILTPTGSAVPGDLAIPGEIAMVEPSKLCVWVDPIDGTREYVEGIKSAVTCLIGIAYEGTPIAGIINRPFSDQTVWAIVGTDRVFGANIPPSRDTARRNIITTRSHFKPAMQTYMDRCQPDDIQRAGGAGGKTLMIVEGVADAYVFPSKGTKRWDTCACEAVFRTLGGSMTDVNGNSYDYSFEIGDPMNGEGIIATLFGAEYHASFLGHSS